MNEDIHCITNEGKTAKNEWENNDSDFLVDLYRVYVKLEQFFFLTLLANMFKRRYISSVASYKYLNKLISEKQKIRLGFLNILSICVHSIARLTVFTRAFCHTRVEHLQKGPE